MGTFADQLAAFGVKAGGATDDVVSGSILEAGQRLITRSPVDTGQFADNWFYGLEAPDTRTHGPTGERAINNLEEMPKKTSGFVHFLSNSIPYGPELERGSSKQAPQGVVGLTAIEWPSIVEQVALRVVK